MRQFLEGDPAVVGQVEQVDCVDDLLHRDNKVDNPKVIFQSMPNENSPAIDEEAQLLVG